MQNFDAIRPYRDDEVPGVIERLANDPALLRAAAAFFAPRLARWLPGLARFAARRVIQRRTAGLDSVHDVQLWLADHMARVVRDTTVELTIDGLDAHNIIVVQECDWKLQGCKARPGATTFFF